MYSLKQLQWISYDIFNLKTCLSKSRLYNLEHTFKTGKFSFYYNCFLTVMCTKATKVRKRMSRNTKLQIMATFSDTKSNKRILKAEPSKNVETRSYANTSSLDCLSGTCSKEEEIKSNYKESIKSFKDSNNDNSANSSSAQAFSYKTVTKENDCYLSNANANWRYYNYDWSAVNVQQNASVSRPATLRPFSDSPLYMANLPVSTSVDSNNKYSMHRVNTMDTTNITAVAEKERQQAWAWRTWQRTNYGKKYKGNENHFGCNFKIMTYNVLAQELLTEHSYLYRNHHPRALLWEQRWDNLITEIKQHDADILCFQEVQSSHLENYYNELENLGYTGLYKQRTGIRNDGCAIYYKNSVFNLVEHATVEFNQSQVPVLNRDNVAIIAKFSPKNSQSEFVVATTHLLYNPRREDVRLAQTQVLLTEIDRISFKKNCSKRSNLPVIITGDFNLTPTSAVYELITSGRLNYEHLTNKSLTRIVANETTVNTTGKFLLPSFLRITDQCQHADLIEKRKEGKSCTREQELELIQLEHSERPINGKCYKNTNKALYSSGTLSHNFALLSAYEHTTEGYREATTFQDKWVTVDYIFYSGVRDKYDLIKEGKLKLIARYTVPTENQLQDAKIPNFIYGSDHFSLVAKFNLVP